MLLSLEMGIEIRDCFIPKVINWHEENKKVPSGKINFKNMFNISICLRSSGKKINCQPVVAP